MGLSLFTVAGKNGYNIDNGSAGPLVLSCHSTNHCIWIQIVSCAIMNQEIDIWNEIWGHTFYKLRES